MECIKGLIYILLLSTIITGCSMKLYNAITFIFSTEENLKKDNTQVNLIIYSEKMASEWYPYQKRVSIVKDGDILVDNITEEYVSGSYIQVINLMLRTQPSQLTQSGLSSRQPKLSPNGEMI